VRAQPLSGTILGFDFGEKRVGVAVGETATGIANALRTIEAVASDARFAAIDALVREWQPVLLVVGRPRHEQGGEHAVARLAEKFARRLQSRHGLPVVFVDETLSSAAAESDFREGRTRPRRAADIDALAARIILQSYLDHPSAHERLAS
jgi:putative holliday junction resolvase